MLNNNEVFLRTLTSFQNEGKNFRLWSIGTSIPDILINFFKRIMINNQDDYKKIELHVHDKGNDFYALTSDEGDNYAPYDVSKNDQTQFKLGAMRQYIQTLISFGILECSTNVFEMNGVDFLRSKYKGENVTYSINKNIEVFILKKDIEGYMNFAFDYLRLMSRLGLAEAQNICFTCALIYGAFHLPEDGYIKNVIQKNTKIYEGEIWELKKYLNRCGYDYFNKFIDDINDEDWMKNLSSFILGVLPYEKEN